MKTQRDQLLDILASGVDFKGEITFVFDTTKEPVEIPSGFKDLAKQNTSLRQANGLLKTTIEELRTKTPAPIPAPPSSGKRAYRAQLKDEQVWDIRDYIKQGYGDAKIRDLMGNTFKASTVWRIRRNKAYGRVKSRPHPTVVRAGHGVISP